LTKGRKMINTKEMKKASYGFAHIFLILIVLLGVGGLGYYMYANNKSNNDISPNANATITSAPNSESSLSPTSSQEDQTTDWKTHTTSSYTIKYPQNWKLRTETDYVNIYNPDTVDSKGEANGTGLYNNSSEFLIVSTQNSTKTAKQFVDELLKTDPAYTTLSTTQIARENIKVGTFVAEKIKDQGEGSIGNVYYVSNGEVIARIQTSANMQNEISVDNQIVATFKLTD
jgi:hypothetical protein